MSLTAGEKDVSQMTFYETLYDSLLEFMTPSPLLKFQPQKLTTGGDSGSGYAVAWSRYGESIALMKIIDLCLRLTTMRNKCKDSHLEDAMKEDLVEAFSLLNLQHGLESSSFSSEPENSSNKMVISFDVFGIDKNHLTRKAKQLVTKEHLNFLQSLVAEFISEQCHSLTSFVALPDDLSSTSTYSSTSTFSTFSTSRMMKEVVSHVRNCERNFEAKLILVERQREKRRRVVHQVFEQLVEYATTLVNLKRHRMVDFPSQHLHHVTLSVKSFLMKITSMQSEFMATLYDQSAVSALRKIDSKLTAEHESLQEDLRLVEYKLEAYRGLSPQFADLQKTYNTLRKDLQFFDA